MAWRITHDYQFDGDYHDRTFVGKGVGAIVDNDTRWKFRLYNEDGERLFSGFSDDESFDPLDGMEDLASDVFEIRYLQKDGTWMALPQGDFNCQPDVGKIEEALLVERLQLMVQPGVLVCPYKTETGWRTLLCKDGIGVVIAVAGTYNNNYCACEGV